MERAAHPERQIAATRGGLPPWLFVLAFVLVFLLQSLLAGQHHHDGVAKTRHCAACALHVQPLAGPPAAVAPAQSVGPAFLYRLFAAAVARHDAVGAAYLLPPAQAPPRFLPTH